MYKSENQVKTYHNLQPRSHKQNHSSVKNMQQNTSYLIPYQANSNHSTFNNYQAKRYYSTQQVLNPQSSVGYYNGQNVPINHQQYHGFGQLQLPRQTNGLNSFYGLQANNS